MMQIYKYYLSHPNNIIVIAQNETGNNVLNHIFDENNEKFLKFFLATQIGCIRPV